MASASASPLKECLSLLCRIYFEGKYQHYENAYNDAYPVEREIRRLTEPAQMECQRVPTYLPLLTSICQQYLAGGYQGFSLATLNKKIADINHTPASVPWHLINKLTVYGSTDYTFYVDFHNDGLEYIVERLAYYTGCPPESIELLSAGVVYTGPFFKYAFHASDLSYCILPYSPPAPERLDLSGLVSDTIYGFNSPAGDFEEVD